jgi:hypothetical protein
MKLLEYFLSWTITRVFLCTDFHCFEIHIEFIGPISLVFALKT